MKTVKMNVTNEQTNEKNEQLVKTHPVDEFNVIQLVNIENKGWQICFTNAIISPEIFATTQEAEEYIKNNLVKLLVPITTLCIERYNEFHEKKSNK
ncbi:MAG: hypothetical protein QXF82_05705 [Nitrososphaeria archaeon]